MVVGQLNLEDDNDNDDTHNNSIENANQNASNVGQVSNLFGEERGPEFDTTLTLGHNYLIISL